MRTLQDEAHKCFSENARPYMSVVSNRMNEVTKVLTIIRTIFIPLTFLAGAMIMWFRRRGWR